PSTLAEVGVIAQLTDLAAGHQFHRPVPPRELKPLVHLTANEHAAAADMLDVLKDSFPRFRHPRTAMPNGDVRVHTMPLGELCVTSRCDVTRHLQQPDYRVLLNEYVVVDPELVR